MVTYYKYCTCTLLYMLIPCCRYGVFGTHLPLARSCCDIPFFRGLNVTVCKNNQFFLKRQRFCAKKWLLGWIYWRNSVFWACLLSILLLTRRYMTLAARTIKNARHRLMPCEELWQICRFNCISRFGLVSGLSSGWCGSGGRWHQQWYHACGRWHRASHHAALCGSWRSAGAGCE